MPEACDRHAYVFGVLIAISLLGVVVSLQGAGPTPSNGASAGSGADPSTLPLIQPSNVEYLGAFRLPGDLGDSANGFGFGGSPIAYNPANNSLFAGGNPFELMVAEISIPTPVKSDQLGDLPIANMLQDFADPTEGQIWNLSSDSSVLFGGLLVSGGKLYGTGYIYYDGDYEQRVSHYSRSLNLSVPSATALQTVSSPEQTGFVSGYLAETPPDWQSTLGGAAITGQCCIPIITRTSLGPDAYAWNPADLGRMSPVPATPLTVYDLLHPTLGPWQGSNPVYGATTQIGGLAVIGGSRTALFVGVNGTGPFCYGTNTYDPFEAGLPVGDGDSFCYDPYHPGKGQHAYPYNYQMWAYDMNDWAAVRARVKQPWEVTPYAVWQLNLPWDGFMTVGGVAYDSATRTLYVSETGVDTADDENFYGPVIHVFRIH